MASDAIPDEIRAFIVKSIDSIAQIESLMLLRRDPARSWDAASLAANLYIPAEEAKRVLEHLKAQGLCDIGSAGYAYGRVSADMENIIDKLTKLYARQLIPVTNLIHSKGSLRVQQFADAFRLRKED